MTIIETIESLERQLPNLQGTYRQKAQERIMELRRKLRDGTALPEDLV